MVARFMIATPIAMRSACAICNAKYADVVKAVEVDAYMKSLPVGLFELPTGAPR
jgi:hypothetical protein